MAKRISAITTITPTATGDAANLVDATYPFLLQGASATQRTNVLEVFLGGQATSSAVAIILLSRDSQVGSGTNTSGTGQTDAAVDAATAALAAPVVVGNSNATNKPQRSSTLHLQNLSFNAFGGIVKWQAPQGWEPSIVGASASLGEVSVSAFTGSSASAAMGGHLIYETL